MADNRFADRSEGMTYSPQDLIDILPASLDLRFAQNKAIPPQVTFTRSTTATYFDKSGVLQSAAVNEARFEHVYDGANWVSQGLLMEAAKTNLFTQSEDVSHADWAKNQTTVDANSRLAPDGNVAMDRILEKATTNQHGVFQSPAMDASSNYTLSAYVAAGGRDWVALLIIDRDNVSNTGWFNLSTGAVGTTSGVSAAIEDIGGGIYRIAVVADSGTGATTPVFAVLNASADNVTSYLGDTSKGVYIWGMQAEKGDFPSSYIPTTTAALTRALDVASVTDMSWFNQSKGAALCIAFQKYAVSATNVLFQADDGGSTDRILLYQLSTGFVIMASNNSAGNDGSSASPDATTPGTQFKAIGAYQQDDMVAGLDGAVDTTPDTTVDLPTTDPITTLRIGNNNSGATSFDGCISRLAMWSKRLPDAVLNRLTS